MSEPDATQPYEQTPAPRKSRRLWWILGGGALLLYVLGSCVKGGIDLYKAVTARNAATEMLAQRFMAEGLPSADDPVYARRAGVDQASLDSLNRFMKQFGKVSEFTPASCNIVSSANADPAQSGTFANCTLAAKAELSPVTIAVRWVREDETWKLLDFQTHFTDNTVLIDKAEKLDRIEAGEEVPVPDTQ